MLTPGRPFSAYYLGNGSATLIFHHGIALPSVSQACAPQCFCRTWVFHTRSSRRASEPEVVSSHTNFLQKTARENTIIDDVGAM